MYRIIDIQITETSPTEPVILAEVKTQLHITDTENDTELTDMITRVRKFIEKKTSVSLVAKDVVLTVDLDGTEFELPYGPIDEITEIKVRTGTALIGTAEYDTLVGDEFTTDGEDFKIFNSSKCGRHKISYSTLAITDEDFKLAVLEEIVYRYENKGDETVPMTGMSMGAIKLIEPFIRLRWL